MYSLSWEQPRRNSFNASSYVTSSTYKLQANVYAQASSAWYAWYGICQNGLTCNCPYMCGILGFVTHKGLVISNLSPTMSCQWTSVSSGLSFGSHTLPIEQGRFARPAIPRHLRRCTVCDKQAVGDELHCVFDCPGFLACSKMLRGACV